ncbi:hypothetical protein [Nocardia carnea]|uniref:hypothetical protein n=1 Tax=Nocardia carnea TaxID=37328 RepID=UPI00031D01A3|nr:hypothetical protein [Nocardia carnea]
MARRKKYTEEERAARDAADKAIRDGGNDLLSDPEAVAEMINQLARLTSPRLLRYSLGNVALIFKQAAERGMTVTDVESYKGWRLRGRYVPRGTTGLRINAPKGTEKGEADQEQSEQPALEAPESAESDGDTLKTRFRMVTVFDISQTLGIEDFEDEPTEVAPVTEPAAAVRARLLEQFDAVGYTVTEGEAPAIDDDAHTVTVSDGQPLEELAQALAALLTRPADERPRQNRPTAASARAATEPAPGIPLDLGEFGTGRAVVEIDHEAARVYYKVSAPSVRGTFTVEFHEAAESGVEPRRVRVKYGRADKPGGAYGRFGQDRPDRPKVNSIRLADSSIVTLSEVENLQWLYVSRLVQGRYDVTTDRVPARTGDRVRAVVCAIVRHFQTLPEFGALFTRAAALEAPVLQRIHNERIRQLSQHIARTESELEGAEQRARYYAQLAAGGEIEGAQLEIFVS